MKTQEEIKRNPFRVPENYFEDANRRIISSISGIAPQAKKKGLLVRMRPALAIAASVAVVVMLSYAAVKLLTTGNTGRIMKGITTEELAATYFEDDDLYSLEDKVNRLKINVAEPVAGNNDIIDYLLLEDIDVDEIYENL